MLRTMSCVTCCSVVSSILSCSESDRRRVYLPLLVTALQKASSSIDFGRVRRLPCEHSSLCSSPSINGLVPFRFIHLPSHLPCAQCETNQRMICRYVECVYIYVEKPRPITCALGSTRMLLEFDFILRCFLGQVCSAQVQTPWQR